MISVIVPIYKTEKYLNKCIDSILNQTYRDLEVILVDDESPDNCGKICEEYAKKDSRVKVFHKENKGQSAARNMAIDVANGEYIGFIDSDDYIESDMFECLIKVINENNADIAICGYRSINEGEEVEPATKNHKVTKMSSDDLWQEIFGRLNNAAWNKLYRKEILGDIRFPLDQYHGEDLLFNLNYINKCQNGVLISGEFYNYLQRAGSVTSGKFTEKKFGEITSKDLALKFVDKNYPKLRKTAEKYCFRARMNIIRAIFRNNLESEYAEKLKICQEYVKENYKKVYTNISIKEKIEYNLYTKLNFAYRIITKRR